MHTCTHTHTSHTHTHARHTPSCNKYNTTDQEFVVYFQKRTKIVRAKPEDYYRIYSIPINSAIKFIPLHKDDAKFSRSEWEGDFDNVADLSRLKVLPLVSLLPSHLQTVQLNAINNRLHFQFTLFVLNSESIQLVGSGSGEINPIVKMKDCIQTRLKTSSNKCGGVGLWHPCRYNNIALSHFLFIE